MYTYSLRVGVVINMSYIYVHILPDLPTPVTNNTEAYHDNPRFFIAVAQYDHNKCTVSCELTTDLQSWE